MKVVKEVFLNFSQIVVGRVFSTTFSEIMKL